MLDTALMLLVIAGLLAIVGVCQPLAARLRLPPSVLLAAIGVGIGAFPAVAARWGLAGSVDRAAGAFAGLPINATMFIYVFLPLLVFEAGIVTDVRRTVEDAAAILLLAVIVTVFTMAAIGFALWPFARMPLAVCLLLGAIVATTDPAAVIAVFRDVGAPARLTRLVAGEALLNDAAAIARTRRIRRIVRRRRHRRFCAGPHPAVDRAISGRRPARRGDAVGGVRLFCIHRGTALP
jgi:CPA1 family monovalent cation:H+ antiporter